jgi:hypothetical protein
MFITKRKHYKEIEKLRIKLFLTRKKYHVVLEKLLDIGYETVFLSDKKDFPENFHYKITMTFDPRMTFILRKYDDDDVFVDHLFEGIKHKLKAELKKLVKKLRTKK